VLDTEAAWDRLQQAEVVREAVAALPLRLRTVVILREFERLPIGRLLRSWGSPSAEAVDSVVFVNGVVAPSAPLIGSGRVVEIDGVTPASRGAPPGHESELTSCIALPTIPSKSQIGDRGHRLEVEPPV